jgi:hypothetical protein
MVFAIIQQEDQIMKIPVSIQSYVIEIKYTCSYGEMRCFKTNLNSVAFSLSELYRPSDHRLSVKLVPTFADRGCRVISATDSHGR